MELLPIPATEIPLGFAGGQEMEIPMGQHLSCSGIQRFNPSSPFLPLAGCLHHFITA